MNFTDFKYATSLVGKHVHFYATCELFPRQGIEGRVIRIEYANNGELLYIVKTPKRGLEMSVGSRTAGLRLEML